MITDLFSHKIHSSGNDWPDKLAELAFLFSEFDNQLYDRDAIETQLIKISPRSSYVARDPSKFRDEYSAYPAYFGLYHLEPSSKGWVIKLSETARKLLIREEPDVASFLRLQLTLFQYPNGMGAAYYSGTNNLRLQANTRDRTLSFIKSNVHLSPLRLIVTALLANAEIQNKSLFEVQITFDEIFALANASSVNTSALPLLSQVRDTLIKVQTGKLTPPPKFERRFHLLKHLELFEIGRGGIQVRQYVNEADKVDLGSKLHTIAKVNNEFNGFDDVSTSDELREKIIQGEWSRYFDGFATLDNDVIQTLTSDLVTMISTVQPGLPTMLPVLPKTYTLKTRDEFTPIPKKSSRKRDLADPEITQIKRQRRNLAHKMLVDQMDSLLRSLGAEPMESQHIDLYAKIPDDGSFIFEMKSGGENLLAQIRKGLSQLYEYRFRYNDQMEDDITLCMVLPKQPSEIPWIQEYLCEDREICLCWFTSRGTLEYPDTCTDKMQYLIN
jgi:hypothetical protein